MFFIHEDPGRGFSLDRRHIKNQDLKIIASLYKFDEYKPFKLFDYMTIIEKAAEVHVIESSFKALIDSYILNKNHMYLHVYVKGRGNKTLSSSNTNWHYLY